DDDDHLIVEKRLAVIVNTLQRLAATNAEWARIAPVRKEYLFDTENPHPSTNGELHGERTEPKARVAHTPLTATLEVHERTVLINGSPVALGMTTEKADDAIAFLGVLATEPGNWFSSSGIGKKTKKEGTRFDLVFKVLPKPIKSCIESSRRKGY